nr:uncharacterized protein LOC127333971 [Lolium perenne]
MGGLGLLNTKKMNIALFLKWVWRLYLEDDAIWAKIARAKYTDADNLFAGSGQGGSPFWKSMHKIKHYFTLGTKLTLHNGARTRFWLDWWTGVAPLKDCFLSLFAICEDPEVLVAQYFVNNELAIRLCRSLDPIGMEQWRVLRRLVADVNLGGGPDQVSWHLNSSGLFSVKSMYTKLSQGATVVYQKDLWSAAVPLKIKIFSWQLALDKLPSSSQIVIRQGPSDGLCALCGGFEDASHIFFACSLARFAWSVLRQLLGCNWNPSNFAAVSPYSF